MPRITSVRLDDDLADRLDTLAAALDRPRSWLIEQAISRYVEEEADHVAAVGQALADYRGGQAALRPHGDVMARLESKIREAAGDADPVA
jgi:predicted transcriptional regulator